MKSIRIVWGIITFTIMQLAKDIKSLVVLLLMPLILIAILGVSLSGMFGNSEYKFQQAQLAIVDEDHTDFSNLFIGNAFSNTAIKNLINGVEYSKQEAEEKFKNKEVDGILYLHKGYGENYLNGIPDELVLKMNPIKATQTDVIRTTFDQYHAIGHMVIDQYDFTNASYEFPSVNSFLAENKIAIEVATVGGDGNYINAFQYYTVGMGVMYSLFTMLTGLSLVIDEVQQNTLKRIRLMPFSTNLFYLGKSLAFMLIMILQLIILFTVCHLIFGVDFGTELLAMFLCICVYSFALSSLMVLLFRFIRSQNVMSILFSIGVPVLAALGGSMVPISTFPAFFESLSKLLPNRNALDAFFNIIMGRTNEAIDSIVFLLVFALVTIAISVLWQVFGKKEEIA